MGPAKRRVLVPCCPRILEVLHQELHHEFEQAADKTEQYGSGA
jgi:hypothetical protein